MVLITLLTACLKSPAVVSSPTAETWPAWMILEMEEDESVPTTVSTRLSEVAKAHNISLQLQPTPSDFEFSKHVAAAAPVLVIESSAEFYAQVNGRFRWEVDVKIDLFDGSEHITEELVIPVFHQFHHERHAEALEAALPTLERKLHTLLNKHLSAK